jgi:hypothetical protein
MARLVRAIHNPVTVWMARIVASDSVATGHDDGGNEVTKKKPGIAAGLFLLR